MPELPPHRLPAAEARRAHAGGRLSPRDLALSRRARIEQREPEIRARQTLDRAAA